MEKIFIAYGGGWAYKDTLRRIEREARRLGIFDKVIIYRPEDMPLPIKASPLKIYERGNGYWVWKPYIIWKTLQKYPNAVVVYADAGCKLQPNMVEWNYWFNLMNEYQTLAFRYRNDYMYPWESELHCKTTECEWTKNSLIEYFVPLIGNNNWLSNPQCLSGFIIARNPRNTMIKMWMDIVLMRPDLFIDAFGSETTTQNRSFIEHRHDQSVWSALATYFETKGNVVKVLQETAESNPNAAVVAARIRREPPVPLKTRIIWLIKSLIGENMYEFLHGRKKILQ